MFTLENLNISTYLNREFKYNLFNSVFNFIILVICSLSIYQQLNSIDKQAGRNYCCLKTKPHKISHTYASRLLFAAQPPITVIH